MLKLQALSVARGSPDSSAADEGEIARLFLRHAESAVRLAFHLTRDREMALDLSQEAFVKAIESFDKLDDPARASAWFHRIVVNLCRDWLKHRQVERRALGRMAEQSVASPLDPALGLEGQESGGRLRAAVLALPLELREVISLVAIEGYTSREAARILNVPEGTIRWRLHEARKLLKQSL